ncbi:hypothetical protein LF95_10935 [Thalassospira sp. TSL5-1]|nr:hypothetical protein LF95_10935 [Thalassospira sp. TSL5-1]
MIRSGTMTGSVKTENLPGRYDIIVAKIDNPLALQTKNPFDHPVTAKGVNTTDKMSIRAR